MDNTNRVFVEKLKGIREQLELSDGKVLEEIKRELETTLDSVVSDYKEESRKEAYSFEEERKMPVFAYNESIALCGIREEDRAPYLKLQKENSIMPAAYKMEGFEDIMWESIFEEQSFHVIIRRRDDDVFVGYCGIKNIKKETWELEIEILKEFHNQQYGRQALALFMSKVYERSGESKFIARVDGENVASQKMCEAIGAIPDGITENLLHDEEYMESYEKEYLHEVTNPMRRAAEKFGVEPPKLLTHVLKYRFDLKK